ncbi:hypothetical protein FZC73_10740 [Enterobacter hormaechei]|nr:hypothetical protein [Enterobacter hormaechei]ELI6760098.1 hypothetical protein [Enterobacter hormaechei subsp. xiangfangensis]ELX7456543.1 hypothetical protein [Enterobacter hormaechei subsp. hoffmannii]EJV4646461.1 hypothetical protein [Enterobacter hormaechei]ELC6311165.1 hypothetical protein [Enterobacter hormaechei]
MKLLKESVNETLGKHLLMTFSLMATLFTPASWSADECQLTLTPVLNDRQFNHIGDTVTLESNLMWEVLTK